MIFQHYRELVPKREAGKFWQIMPEESQPAAKPTDAMAAKSGSSRRTKPAAKPTPSPNAGARITAA
jgi:hypothetical protein